MNWAQLTLKQTEEEGSEGITSYKTNVNKYISASNQPWHASAGSPMGFWGSFLVMPRWFGLTAGRTGPSVREPPNADRQPALLPVGLSATTLPYPIFLFPLHSTVPEKVKLNHEIKVTITINVIS